MRIEAANLEASRPLVLAVDDSIDVLRLLKARLRHETLDFETASTGTEGLEMAKRLNPALILLDIELPDIDGFEILRQLKERPETVQTPVIMLSGLSSAHDKVTAFDLGAVDYVTKPFDIAELRVRIRAAIRTHLLLQMLAQRAQIDGLTGLWNRAYFDRRLSEELARCARHERPVSLAIFDIDRFKLINDTYGHPAGDAVLTGFSSLLRREIRETDIPCRYGGEEFALIMPDTCPEDALAVCERIRTTLEQVAWPRHPDHAVTVSTGIAGSNRCGFHTEGAWLETADRNLYAAKTGGRNRTISSTMEAAGRSLPKAG
ncbi:MAG: diguanylate cyclase [Phycisphaeraceae bacterium]|nr:diguanylate cyclase [Phycisphaeraceae bacterium]MBX3366344.1 diguanylate cyclase [Phycisphaeraceae bacterium]QYK48800.1 MAG: diguanylate cyclase [Phycisphaeraceae bacterium]